LVLAVAVEVLQMGQFRSVAVLLAGAGAEPARPRSDIPGNY
jgi:hypothetical protein